MPMWPCRHGGGVLKSISDTLVAVVIPEGAHHLDLMFSHPLDPPSVLAARSTQLSNIRRWIAQAAARQKEEGLAATSGQPRMTVQQSRAGPLLRFDWVDFLG